MISVCVVLFNTEQNLLTRCLQAVEISCLRSGEQCEIVLVDNGSDRPLNIKPGTIPIRIVRNELNLGFASAMNSAVRLADGEICFCLNPDTVLESEAIAELWTALRSRPGRTLLVGYLCKSDGVQVDALTTWMSSFGRYFSRSRKRRAIEKSAELGSPFAVEKVSGGALFGERDHLVDLGPFDDRFFLYGEDVDLSFRAVRAGYQLFTVPKARVFHVGASSAESHGVLVEMARQDAAIRLTSYHAGYVMSLLLRLEACVVVFLGGLLGRRSTSASWRARAARLRVIRSWGFKRDLERFTP